MDENSIKLLTIVFTMLGTIVWMLVIQTIWKKLVLRFNPKDEYAWPKKYLDRKMKYPHPVYKQDVVGTCKGILPTKDKGKGGVPRYKLHMEEGSGSFTDIWLDSKWEYADVKNRP